MSSSPDNPEKSQREIAIFWDYENVPLPTWCSATQAAKAIVDTVSPYGRIVDRRLYCGNSQPRNGSSLDSSGFDLVVSPTRNQKESLDKKLIADVLTFAWDSAVRNDSTKPCVVLLTGDGDYAYTLSKLRDRGIMTIVMVGQDCTVASILVETADVALSLEDDVLCNIDTSCKKSTLSPSVKTTMTSSPSVKATMTDGSDDLVLMQTICRSIQRLTSEDDSDGWTDSGQISLILQKAIRQRNPGATPEFVKQQARAVRQQAESGGYIELGRRRLDTAIGTQREIVRSGDHRNSRTSGNLSNEIYARLLPKGEQLLRQGFALGTMPRERTTSLSPAKDKDNNSKTHTLFIRSLPLRMDIQHFVNVIQTTFNVTVSRARLDYPKGTTFCNALVEFVDESDAATVLRGTNKVTGGKGLHYGGRSVGAVPNTRPNPFATDTRYMSSRVYYEIRGEHRKVASSPRNLDRQVLTIESDDSKLFCRAVDLARKKKGGSDDWINAGSVGSTFQSLLPSLYLRATSKEDVSLRFKSARNNAISDGLVEMGRRELTSSFQEEDFSHSYLPVALDSLGQPWIDNQYIWQTFS